MLLEQVSELSRELLEILGVAGGDLGQKQNRGDRQ